MTSSDSKTVQTSPFCIILQPLRLHMPLAQPKSSKLKLRTVQLQQAQMSSPEKTAYLPKVPQWVQPLHKPHSPWNYKTWLSCIHVFLWRMAKRKLRVQTWSKWEVLRSILNCRSRTPCIFWKRCFEVSCRLWTWSWRQLLRTPLFSSSAHAIKSLEINNRFTLTITHETQISSKPSRYFDPAWIVLNKDHIKNASTNSLFYKLW